MCILFLQIYYWLLVIFRTAPAVVCSSFTQTIQEKEKLKHIIYLNGIGFHLLIQHRRCPPPPFRCYTVYVLDKYKMSSTYLINFIIYPSFPPQFVHPYTWGGWYSPSCKTLLLPLQRTIIPHIPHRKCALHSSESCEKFHSLQHRKTVLSSLINLFSFNL